MQKKLLTNTTFLNNKNIHKLGIKGTFLNIINALYNNLTTNILIDKNAYSHHSYST